MTSRRAFLASLVALAATTAVDPLALARDTSPIDWSDWNLIQLAWSPSHGTWAYVNGERVAAPSVMRKIASLITIDPITGSIRTSWQTIHLNDLDSPKAVRFECYLRVTAEHGELIDDFWVAA